MPSAEPNIAAAAPIQPVEVSVTSGALLKQRRREKDLTVQEVAVQLRLDPRVIQALEADDYAGFAADTYIRGYLRSYAKLVGLDGDRVISLYHNDAPEPPEIIPDVKHPSQVSSSDKPVKAFTYLLTFILALLVGIWWWQGNFMSAGTSGISGTTEPVVTDPRYIPAAPAIENISDDIQFADDPDLLSEFYTPAEDQLHLAPAETIQSVNSPAVDNSSTVIEPGIVPGTAADTETQPPADSAAPAAETTDDNAAMPGPDQIYLRLNADCWIEVHDRYGKEVYVDLARTGEEVYLTGFAPFQVKLGNAQGVVLEYNQQAFDPAPYTAKGIARFTLEN